MVNLDFIFNRYRHHSERAVKFEQEECWQKAMIEWREAQQYATNANDEQWCEYHHHFCEKTYKRTLREETL